MANIPADCRPHSICDTDDEDRQLERMFENDPVVIASQIQIGSVINEREYKAIQTLLSQSARNEDELTETYHNGRVAGFREVGGAELVAAVEMEDQERIAKLVRKHMDKLYAGKNQTRQ